MPSFVEISALILNNKGISTGVTYHNNDDMSHDARKPVLRVSNQVWHKPACKVIEKG